ncbi:LPP leucine zipper domain-containing protein [Parashewanella curva]|nr:LPP leucine zipper domain-containing protein [Parashewanella curva]
MKKIFTIAVISLPLFLAGCATDAALQDHIHATNQKLDLLSSQISDLQSQHDQLMNSIKHNQSASERANDRLDNLATHYKK